MRKMLFIVIIMALLFIIINNQYIGKQQDCAYIECEREYLNKYSVSDRIHIYVDLPQTLLYVFDGDELIKKYSIAIGKSSTPSPIGTWKVIQKAKNWGTGFGSRWLGLDVPWGIYGIHGTNKPGSIGYAASKGCIRMNNKDVEELYELVPYHAIVIIDGGPYGNLGSGVRRLKPGDRGADVLEVQKRLKFKGYYDGALDGRFGIDTKQSLLEYKKDNGLPINDNVDQQTYESLGIVIFE